MKNVLVTGSTGFIGKNLIKRLLNQDVNIYVLARNNIDNIEFAQSEKINYIISTPQELISNKNLPQMDVCFNLVGYGVNYLDNNINEMLYGNREYLINLITFAKYNKSRILINTGSGAEYGSDYFDKKISEKLIANPKSLYGITKLSGYKIGNIYAKENKVNMVTVRPFGVYGPYEHRYRLFPQLIESIETNKMLPMTLGEQIRDYIYIDDLIDAYLKISMSDNIEIYGAYNICSGKGISIREIVNILKEIYKKDSDIFKFGMIPYRENEIMHYVGDNSKILNDLDWEPSIGIKEGLMRTIEWWKNINYK